MSVEEPNPGRTTKGATNQRNQRRSVFITAMIGATVTAILAGAAAFRIHDASAKNHVKIVTTTTVPRTSTTADPSADTTFTTEFVPSTDVPGSDPTTDTTAAATTTSSSTSTSTTSTTVAHAPPPPPGHQGAPNIVWHLSPASATLQSGAQMTLIITATNAGNAGGTVTVPPCAAAPHPDSVVRSQAGDPLSNSCHPGPQTLSIAPGQHYNWTDTISATNDATRYGSPLARGQLSGGRDRRAVARRLPAPGGQVVAIPC